jgi:hypothetical protein
MASELGFLTCKALLDGRIPVIVCLQETHLRPSHALRLRGYATHRYDNPAGERASGATALLVKDCICCVPVGPPFPVAGHRCACASAHATLHPVQYQHVEPTGGLTVTVTGTVHPSRVILIPSIFFGMETSLTAGEH